VTVSQTIPTEPELPADPPPPPPQPAGLRGVLSRTRKNPVVDLVLTLVVAVIIAYVTQLYIVKPYRIPSGSMERTFHIGDRVLAVRFLYRFEDPHRGDILIFHPNGEGDQAIAGPHVASVTFTKRLIGLPGEWVRARQGSIQICATADTGCKTLHEPYISSTQDEFGPIHIPAGHYFMMGDNRQFSDDSRDWGTIARKQIIGRAFMTYWPPNRIHFY
jgi:signal peptidase I